MNSVGLALFLSTVSLTNITGSQETILALPIVSNLKDGMAAGVLKSCNNSDRITSCFVETKEASGMATDDHGVLRNATLYFHVTSYDDALNKFSTVADLYAQAMPKRRCARQDPSGKLLAYCFRGYRVVLANLSLIGPSFSISVDPDKD